MYSCTECGRCSSHCPATISGKALAPRQLLLEPARLSVRARGRGARDRRRRQRRRRRQAVADRREHRRRAPDPRRGALGLHDLPRLRGGLPGADRVRRQDRRHAPPPGAGGVALPGRADPHLQGDGDAGQPVGHRRVDARRLGRRARHPDHRREARRRVPLLRRLRRLVRRPQQADDAGRGQDPQAGGRRLRHPRRRGAVQRRDRAPHRQRVPLPDHGADGGRGARQLQGAARSSPTARTASTRSRTTTRSSAATTR